MASIERAVRKLLRPWLCATGIERAVTSWRAGGGAGGAEAPGTRPGRGPQHSDKDQSKTGGPPGGGREKLRAFHTKRDFTYC